MRINMESIFTLDKGRALKSYVKMLEDLLDHLLVFNKQGLDFIYKKCNLVYKRKWK